MKNPLTKGVLKTFATIAAGFGLELAGFAVYIKMKDRKARIQAGETAKEELKSMISRE